jgi:hypothetical protein
MSAVNMSNVDISHEVTNSHHPSSQEQEDLTDKIFRFKIEVRPTKRFSYSPGEVISVKVSFDIGFGLLS